jgi:hypothetical protein
MSMIRDARRHSSKFASDGPVSAECAYLSGDHSMSKVHELAQQTEEKFRFYTLSLIFTLLAASIQTAKFGSSHWADGLELLGWAALLIAGLALLWKVEMEPVIRLDQNNFQMTVQSLREVNELKAEGEGEVSIKGGARMPIDEALPLYEMAHSQHVELMKLHNRENRLKYAVARAAFPLALLLLVLARGLPALVNIFGYKLN